MKLPSLKSLILERLESEKVEINLPDEMAGEDALSDTAMADIQYDSSGGQIEVRAALVGDQDLWPKLSDFEKQRIETKLGEMAAQQDKDSHDYRHEQDWKDEKI